MTSQHSSKVSKQVLKIIENPKEDLSKLSQEDLLVFRAEMDNFLEDVWIQVGDTEFNRSGLRNATDLLIDHLRRLGYYSSDRLSH